MAFEEVATAYVAVVPSAKGLAENLTSPQIQRNAVDGLNCRHVLPK